LWIFYNQNEVDLVICSRFLDTKSEEMPDYRKVGIKIITNVSLIGIGCVVIGTVFLMTAVILFSIVTVANDKK
jgi:hypothetical protein